MAESISAVIRVLRCSLYVVFTKYCLEVMAAGHYPKMVLNALVGIGSSAWVTAIADKDKTEVTNS